MPFHVCYLFTFVDCFEILTCHVFLHSVCSVCFIRRCIFQVIRKKKKSSSASVLTLIILLSLLFLKRLCFTPKYINFVYAYVAYVAFIFLLVFAARISVLLLLLFFFPTRSTRTCHCHGKWSFFGFSVVFVVKSGSESVTMFRVLWFVLNAEQGSRVEYKVWRQYRKKALTFNT